MEENQRNTLSLSQLQDGIQQVLQKHYSGSFWVTGEINDISENASGHCYLDLVEKDEGSDKLVAKARATIWAYTYRMLKPYFETTTGYQLKRGIKVLIQAAVEYHPVFGLSLNIQDIDPTYTIGELERKRKEIIDRLQKEGVISMNRELPMPLVPQKIAIISSDSAAGYEDFISQLQLNTYGYVFYSRLFPAVMQGEKAEKSIIKALDGIFDSGVDFNLVVLIRGGGAKSDLACFDSYELAYHITQFPLPVVTGIGHEQDDTITDLVAHTCLKTPTAVAGFLIDTMVAFDSLLESHRRGIIQFSTGHLSHNQLKLQLLNQRIGSGSERHLQQMNDMLGRYASEFRSGVKQELERQKANLDKIDRIRTYVDPKQVLKLGYSIARFKGKAIKDPAGIKEGDQIETSLNKGILQSGVTRIIKN